MNETSLSMLTQLRRSPEAEAWDRLLHLYGPLIRKWLLSYELQTSDADDLVQDVLLAVSTDIQKFDHNGRPGAFRAWIKSILVNRLRNHWRSRDRRPKQTDDSQMEAKLAELDDPASPMSLLWNREHDQYVLRQLLALTEPHFASETWKAFRRVALEGARADAVADEMGISLNAVFIAKSRVLARLRQEAEGLVESYSGFVSGR